MEVNQIIDLMKAVSEAGLTDFTYEESGLKIRMQKRPEKKILPPPHPGQGHCPPPGAPMPPAFGACPPPGASMPPMFGAYPPQGVPQQTNPGSFPPPAMMAAENLQGSAQTAPDAEASDGRTDGQVVNSPLVGTFYAAGSPDAEPFVQVGDTVKKGDVLGIVEAMKLMNEIESDYDGVVKQILVKNGDLVEYDQPLFVIE
ncbi:MAG: acetyl-CoA carboxylase biotin carboxyl carrier protein [Lachnospiraceae bacterium]|nr:acetyl-CoA carboxylase biotin carboxyl carrier protein [Lachnospiraceae bacterium]